MLVARVIILYVVDIGNDGVALDVILEDFQIPLIETATVTLVLFYNEGTSFSILCFNSKSVYASADDLCSD
jgi:lipoprotein signal peptidase